MKLDTKQLIETKTSVIGRVDFFFCCPQKLAPCCLNIMSLATPGPPVSILALNLHNKMLILLNEMSSVLLRKYELLVLYISLIKLDSDNLNNLQIN